MSRCAAVADAHVVDKRMGGLRAQDREQARKRRSRGGGGGRTPLNYDAGTRGRDGASRARAARDERKTNRGSRRFDRECMQRGCGAALRRRRKEVDVFLARACSRGARGYSAVAANRAAYRCSLVIEKRASVSLSFSAV